MRSHGDYSLGNLVNQGADVVALDWATFGWEPLGFDLAHLGLASGQDPRSAYRASTSRWEEHAVAKGFASALAIIGPSRVHWMLSAGVDILTGTSTSYVSTSQSDSAPHSATHIAPTCVAKTPGPLRRIRPERRFLSPQVEGQFSLRQNRNHVHIVQTKVGVLSCLTRKCQSPSWFPISPNPASLPRRRACIRATQDGIFCVGCGYLSKRRRPSLMQLASAVSYRERASLKRPGTCIAWPLPNNRKIEGSRFTA